jgi:hypothetical protein
VKVPCHRRVEGGAAADEEAQRRAETAVDAGEEAGPQVEAERAHREAVQPEQRPEGAARERRFLSQLLLDPVVEKIEELGHGDQDRDARLLERREDFRPPESVGEHHLPPEVEGDQDVDHRGQHVLQRQQAEERLVVPEGDDAEGALDFGEDVPVGEAHPLRGPGGPRGVDDGDDIGGGAPRKRGRAGKSRRPLEESREFPARSLLSRERVERDHLAVRPPSLEGLLEPLAQQPAHENHPRVGVLDQPAPFLGRYLGVEGDGDHPGEIGPEVGRHPFRAVFRENGHAARRLQPEAGEADGDPPGPGVGFAVGDGGVAPRSLEPEGGPVRDAARHRFELLVECGGFRAGELCHGGRART